MGISKINHNSQTSLQTFTALDIQTLAVKSTIPVPNKGLSAKALESRWTISIGVTRINALFTIYCFPLVYKIPYRRARAWPSARASKGILHTSFPQEYENKIQIYYKLTAMNFYLY